MRPGSRRSTRWSETFLDVFKKNGVRLIGYGPDNVLAHGVIALEGDGSVSAARSLARTCL
jgi:hypothetical protein